MVINIKSKVWVSWKWHTIIVTQWEQTLYSHLASKVRYISHLGHKPNIAEPHLASKVRYIAFSMRMNTLLTPSKVRYFHVTPSTLETPRSDCEAFLRWCHQESNRGHKAKFLRPVLCSINKNAPQRLRGVSKVVPPGIEPGTQGFSVLCSTNWAMAPISFCECKFTSYFDTGKAAGCFFAIFGQTRVVGGEE